MKIIRCDRCKKAVEHLGSSTIRGFQILWIKDDDGSNDDENVEDLMSADLCPRCKGKVMTAIYRALRESK